MLGKIGLYEIIKEVKKLYFSKFIPISICTMVIIFISFIVNFSYNLFWGVSVLNVLKKIALGGVLNYLEIWSLIYIFIMYIILISIFYLGYMKLILEIDKNQNYSYKVLVSYMCNFKLYLKSIYLILQVIFRFIRDAIVISIPFIVVVCLIYTFRDQITFIDENRFISIVSVLLVIFLIIVAVKSMFKYILTIFTYVDSNEVRNISYSFNTAEVLSKNNTGLFFKLLIYLILILFTIISIIYLIIYFITYLNAAGVINISIIYNTLVVISLTIFIGYLFTILYILYRLTMFKKYLKK